MRGVRVAARRVAVGVGVGTMASLGAGTAAWAAPPQTQTVVITVDAATGNQTFSATGPASGSGIDTPTSSTQTGNAQHGTDLFTFTDGPSSGSSFTVKHVGHETDTFDPATCSFSVVGDGNFVVTGGTGALSDIKGSGHYTESGTLTFPTEGGCNPNTNPISGSLVVTAVGNVKV
jgi:hypothetical protein